MTTVTVNPFSAVGPVKPMNAVNNGPVAAKDGRGALGVLVARFTDDRNVTASAPVMLRLSAGRFSGRVRGYLTDEDHRHSPVHLFPADDSTVSFSLAPNAFIFIETGFEELEP